MSEAGEIIELATPFVGYIAPALILLTIFATADHIIGFLFKIIASKRIRF